MRRSKPPPHYWTCENCGAVMSRPGENPYPQKCAFCNHVTAAAPQEAGT